MTFDRFILIFASYFGGLKIFGDLIFSEALEFFGDKGPSFSNNEWIDMT